MMNQKINTNYKKETLLTGQICFPLRIGERAVIIGTGSRSMITSRVITIQEVSAPLYDAYQIIAETSTI